LLTFCDSEHPNVADGLLCRSGGKQPTPHIQPHPGPGDRRYSAMFTVRFMELFASHEMCDHSDVQTLGVADHLLVITDSTQ
jgi:hypothetical protein